MQPVHVALCFNDAYLKHIGPLVYALSKNNSDLNFLIHVVYKNLSDDSLEYLSQMEELFDNVTFDFRYITSDLINQVTVQHTHFPVETYFRLILADVLHDVDRLLYLDIDLLISGSVKELWEMDMNGSCIAAAPEKDIYMYYQWYLDQMGLTDNDTYFSAGVLLFDLKQMRERNLPEILLTEAITRGDSLRFCDQDLLNLYFKDEVVYLDDRYNYSAWLMTNGSKTLDELSIQHFNGNLKPWMAITHATDGQRPFVARYHQYRREYHQLLHPNVPLVAVLVDARQTQEHLSDALDSVMCQHYQNLVIYAVLTETDSQTLQQLETYQAYDNRIQVLFCDEAIDSVLALANKEEILGQFVICLKGTDFLEHNAIESLMTLHQDHQADIAVGDYYVLDAQNGIFLIRETNSGARSLLSKNEALSNPNDEHLGTASGKLFTKTLLNRVAVTIEDQALEQNLLTKLYLEANVIAYQESHFFCYRRNLEHPPHRLLTTADTYDNKLRAVQQALMTNHLLGVTTEKLDQLLKDLQIGLEQLDQATLTDYLRHQLTLLRLAYNSDNN